MSCTESSLIKQFKVDLGDTISYLKGRIEEGVRFTKEGVDNNSLLKKYTNIYTNLNSGTEEAIRKLEYLGQLEDDVMFTTIRSNLKEVFKGSIGTGDTINTRANTEMVLESAVAKDRKVTVKVRAGSTYGTYTFKKGTNVSELTSTGKRLYIPLFDVAMDKAYKASNDILAEVDKKARMVEGRARLQEMKDFIYGDKEVLGSSAKKGWVGGVEKAGYVHGDVDHMKSMLLELQTVGNNKASDEHILYLEGLLDAMSPSFFREMTLEINDNAKTTAGWVDIDKKSVLLNLGKKKKTSKSEAEVYAHEVIHSMTAWALEDTSNTKVTSIRRELNYVFNKARESTTWEDLLGKDVSKATKGEIAAAKEMRWYMFESENADDEFITHVLTNPAMKAHAEKLKLKEEGKEDATLLERVMELFYKITDALLGNYKFKDRNNNVRKQVHTLAFRLAEINSGAEAEVDRLNVFTKMNQWVDELDMKMGEKASKYVEKYSDDYDGIRPLKEDAGFIESTAYFAKFVGKSLANKHYRRAAGVGLTSIGIKPDNVVREVIVSLFTPSQHDRLVEWVSMKNTNIDALRNTTVSQSKEFIKRGFKAELHEDEDIALTRAMLDTNLSQLLAVNSKSMTKKVYDKAEVEAMLGNGVGKLLGDATGRLEEIINKSGEESEVNWIKKQASGLGYYMATHKGMLTQQLSAYNIAIGYGSYKRRKLDHNLMEAIHEVAILTAMKYTKQEYKDSLLGLVQKDFEGVKNVGNLFEAFKEESGNKVFAGDRAHMIDGYTKELFDDTTDVKFVPLAKTKEMERLGYKLITKVDPKAGETRTQQLGMFVSDLYGKAERLRGAVNLGGYSAKGVDLKTIKFSENIANKEQAFKTTMNVVNTKAREVLDRMYSSEPLDFSKEEFGLVPIIDSVGNTVNYRYIGIDKDQKAERMRQDLRATEVLSRSMGGLVDKELRSEHNKKVLEVVKELMLPDNWNGGDRGGKKNKLVEYTRIGPTGKNRELYRMLPREFREYAKSREDGIIAVPSHLVHPLFGYSHAQLGSMVPGKVMPEAWRSTVQRVINMVEAYWVDLIKIAKGNILLKMPMVLIGNIVSNTLFMLNTGVSPKEVWRLHQESFKDVKAYMRNHKEATKLGIDIKISTAKLRSETNKDRREQLGREIRSKKESLVRKEKEMKVSPVAELVESGLFQSVVEDVETTQLNDTNLISGGMDKLMSKTPAFIRTPAQWLYLSKETKWYQFNQEVLQLSDLIARDVMNRKQKVLEKEMAEGKRAIPIDIAKELGGVQKGRVLRGRDKEKFMRLSKERRMNFLLDSFINYNKPNSRMEEWAGRVGLFLFTKWLKRIQRVVATTAVNHPIRTLGMLAAAGLAIDVETIQDGSYVARSYGFDGDFSLGNIIPVYTPMDHIMNVVTPPIVKLMD